MRQHGTPGGPVERGPAAGVHADGAKRVAVEKAAQDGAQFWTPAGPQGEGDVPRVGWVKARVAEVLCQHDERVVPL